MKRRDPVIRMSDEAIDELAEQAYAERDDAQAWEEEEPPEVSPEVRSVVSVRFSRGELGPIEAAAAAAGVPVSTYIRNAAINAVSAVDLDDARRSAEALQEGLQRLIGALGKKGGNPQRRQTPRRGKASAA